VGRRGTSVRLVDPDGNYVTSFTASRRSWHGNARDVSRRNTPTRKERVASRFGHPVEARSGLSHRPRRADDAEFSSQWRSGTCPASADSVGRAHSARPNAGTRFLPLRPRRGAADHHSVAILAGPRLVCFTSRPRRSTLKRSGKGSKFLRARGWTHYWGIGRHLWESDLRLLKGSRWRQWEHYADGDLMTADSPTATTRSIAAGCGRGATIYPIRCVRRMTSRPMPRRTRKRCTRRYPPPRPLASLSAPARQRGEALWHR